MPAKFVPTDEHRAMVESMSGFGCPQADIACVLDISIPTLHLAFRRELDLGMAKANAKIGQSLFQQAMNGNTAAAIFWAKARMGWREKQVVELTGEDGAPIKMSLNVGFVGPKP